MRSVLFFSGICALIVSAEDDSPRVILSVVIDDMGFYDAKPNNPNSPTPTLNALAEEGVFLSRHYAYSYCSPTRRSFLTGRYPVHISGVQADVCDNWTPLNMSLLSNKLQIAGYESHFIGKTNIGFQTTDHMPINRGFASHVGYLYGMEDYHHGDICYASEGPNGCRRQSLSALQQAQDPNPTPDPNPHHDRHPTAGHGHPCTLGPGKCIPETDLTAHQTAQDFEKDFWHNNGPGLDLAREVFYSTNFYSDRAVSIIRNFTASSDPSRDKKLYIHLCYQAVHGPYQDVPAWERNATVAPDMSPVYSHMLQVMDQGLRNVTEALRTAGLWSDTLVVIFSDNGGPYGLEGGPNNFPLRGTKESPWEGGTRVFAMVSGGYIPAALRGSTSEAFIHVSDWFPTLATLAGVPPSALYRGHDIDGVDVWPMITGANTTNPREFLPVTEQSIIWLGAKGEQVYKYYSTTAAAFGFSGWKTENGSMIRTWHGSGQLDCDGCLFEIIGDEAERHNIASDHPNLTQRLAAQLNQYTNAVYTTRSMSDSELEDYDCAKLKADLPVSERGSWPSAWPWLVPLPPGPPPPPRPEHNQTHRFDPSHRGPGVSVSTDGLRAGWTKQACNEVVLLEMPPSGSPKDFWVQINETTTQWIDVGFCSPSLPLNLSGSSPKDWMGDQTSPSGTPLAWIYRAGGEFRAAAAVHSPGVSYGGHYSQGSNVTAKWHSRSRLEFLLDGRSQGIIELQPSQALPASGVVGCVGVCGDASIALSGRAAGPKRVAVAGPCCRRKSDMS